MFCSPWVCQWKAPDRPFVFRLADGRPRKKSPMQPTHSSESRSEPKTPANMPSLRQLEFAFRTVAASLWERVALSHGEAATKPAILQTKARQLLRSFGAKRIATELRVEWNSRLKTAAGRADYRQKLISLNPRLVEHPEEIDRDAAPRACSYPRAISRKKSAADFTARTRVAAGLLAIWEIAGEKRCHTLPFPAKRYAPRFIYRCPNCRRDFPRVRQDQTSQSPVWRVAARITAASSMCGFG